MRYLIGGIIASIDTSVIDVNGFYCHSPVLVIIVRFRVLAATLSGLMCNLKSFACCKELLGNEDLLIAFRLESFLKRHSARLRTHVSLRTTMSVNSSLAA